MVDTVNGYRGGLYGFFSGHAANSFGLAMFFVLLVKHRWFSLSVLIWAFLNSIIRTYLGVHFVGDIVVGAVTGMLIGSITYWIYSMFARKDKKSIDVRGSSLLYTRSGFMRSDVYLFISVLFGTYSVILILACFN